MRKRSKSTVRASRQARQDIADTFRRYGPLSIDGLADRSGYSRSHAVQVLRQLCIAEVAQVVETQADGSTGRPLRIYGLVGVHGRQPTVRDRILTLLQVGGPSPSLELARQLGIDPKTARYHLGRLLAARKVEVVGKLQRPTGGTPASIWSACV